MSKPNDPKTILECAAQCHSDEICLADLIKSRWPEGFSCSRGNPKGGWGLAKYNRFECSSCHRPPPRRCQAP